MELNIWTGIASDDVKQSANVEQISTCSTVILAQIVTLTDTAGPKISMLWPCLDFRCLFRSLVNQVLL
jgi:hypothetical protein